MPQGNDGYKIGKGTFATSDILKELSSISTIIPKKKICINLKDFSNPYPAMHFYIYVCLGVKKINPDDTIWENRLNKYMDDAVKHGVSYRRLSAVALKIMNTYKLGCEGYRTIRKQAVRVNYKI